MMMPNPVSPPPVISPRSVSVKWNCFPQSPRMPARTEKPTPSARIAMKPAQRIRCALDETLFSLAIFIWFGGGLTAKIGQLHDLTPAHGRFMRANSGAGPVHGLIHIRERRAAFDDAHDELVREVRMRTAMATALDERQVRVFVVVNALGREPTDRFGQQMRVIRHFHLFGFFAAEVQHRFVAFGQLPFERAILAIDIEALDVLTRGVEEEARHLEADVLVAYLEMRRLERERRTVL